MEDRAVQYFNEGGNFLRLGQYEKAVASYDKAIAIEPDFAFAWYFRGTAISYLGQPVEAVASYDKAIAIEPNDADIWNKRGDALGKLEKYTEAVASYDKAIAIEPNDADILNKRGNVLGILEMYTEAVASYDKAIVINPDFANAWGQRGDALHRIGQHAEAVVSCDKALAIEAVDSCDKALAINPNDACVWYDRGLALSEQGRHAEALHSYDKAIDFHDEFDPDFANKWVSRGDALRELGRYAEAVDSYGKGLELEPQNEFALAEKNKLLNIIHIEQQQKKIENEKKRNQNSTSDETIHEKEDRTIKIAPSIEINRESTPLEIKKFRDFTIDYTYPATGGEADIFRAIDKNKTYIIKIYRYGIVPKEPVLKKVQYISRKYPQHFIELIDYGFDDSTKRWFEIQEYAPFGSFKDFKLDTIDKKDIIVNFISQIAEALKTLHQEQLLHLDLKPANILIRTLSPLDLVLADFGTSSIIDPEISIRMTERKGTPSYWAPEQLSGGVSYTTDYWALGIIILELLNGKHPFYGIDYKVIIYTLATQEVEVPEGLPDDFDILVKGLLTRDPKKRWGYEEISHWIAMHSSRWIAGDRINAFFPYSEYRPGQRHMLEVVASVAREGGIAMIDAPTGSGKSSVVASLLAERKKRKIVIAVRTVSQLTTFIRELELIKKKQPQIKTVYLVGKKSMCPLGGEGDIYFKCEGVKAFSSSLMRDRADKGSLVPTKDPFIIQQIRKLDKEHPLLCPYYIASKMFEPSETGVKMVASNELRAKADRVIAHPVPPWELSEFSGSCCPYELMMEAARNADVMILNYHHLFNCDIREPLYANLGIEPQDVLLLIDEAHNCGDVVTINESVTLEERDLEQASRELSGMRKRHKGAEAVQHVLPRLTEFIRGLANSVEFEDWFDPAIFDRMIVRESHY